MITLDEYKDDLRKSNVREVVYSGKVSNHYFNNTIVGDIVRSFTENGLMHLTRNDIFNERDLRTKIVKILVWGYPGDVRNTPTIIMNIDALESLQNQYENNKLSGEAYLSELLKIRRLGVSTASKILYFMNVQINSYPAIIIDNRVNDSFPIISELSELAAASDAKSYIKANSQIGEIAKKYKIQSEQIEYFLFNGGKIWAKYIQRIIKKEVQQANKALIDNLLKEENGKTISKKKLKENEGSLTVNSLQPGIVINSRVVDFGYYFMVDETPYYLFIGHKPSFHYCELLKKNNHQPISTFPRINYLRENGFDKEGVNFIYRKIRNYDEATARVLLEEIKDAIILPQ